ncbi:MAG: YncE family protein [Steroidobacteraceae bacterium]
MAVDAAGGRVFATPEAAKEVAVLDLNSGRALKLIHDIGDPVGIFYDSLLRRLFVVDAASGDLKIFSGQNYSLIRAIHLGLGADELAYDPRTKVLYVTSSGADAGRDYSLISMVDPVRMETLGNIRIAAPSLESSAIDSGRQLLYVALDSQSSIAVVDLRKRHTVATWKLPTGHRDMALALDSARGRLYVACRDSAMHGSVIVLNTTSGRSLATLPIGGWTDGIFLDRKRNRIYISTGVGHIDTYAIGPSDNYRRLPAVDTSILGKTSLYSDSIDRMFVDVPELYPAAHERARVMEFKPVP